ncbi:MAG: phosphoesterase [Planctomycetaceae bacterium]|nr:phosphoesterase [Planctomycetaceae bacterium]
MRLLLFSDLHCDATAARRLVEMARDVDVVIGAGDFANQHRGLKICLKVLRDITKPAILVAGNNESTDELRDACDDWPSAQILHGTTHTVAGVAFFGLGGGIPTTPFGDWSYDFTDSQATELLRDCPAQFVLVTHSPPQGWVDVASSGQHLGSPAIRDAILRLKPTLVVCGHIHGSAGQQTRHANTAIVNAGPKGILWELPQNDLGDVG